MPDTLASDMEPLFSLRSRTPLRFPPGPKVKLSTKTPVTKTSDRRVIAYRSFVEPMFSLLRLWRRPATAINAVRQRYEEVGGHLPSLAAAAGMGWATLRADLDTLRMIDLPALLQVVGETEERKGYVILLALGDTWVEVATAAGKRRLSLALFSEMYAGNAIVLCDDEFVNPTRLRQGGGINLSVRKLQDYMKAAGHFDGNASGWFTPETAAAVAAFQKEHGLPPSGEADSLTKLLVYASGGLSELPRLRVSE